jgi:hypothetical protein
LFSVVSFAYFVACRMFELLVLLSRGERSKELEILVLRVGCRNPIVMPRRRVRIRG